MILKRELLQQPRSSLNYIKNKLPKLNIQHNIKSIIPPLELDIYIPELKLAIEFNGNYWHSSELKDKFNTELSENENMKNNGFVKIHDCGNAVWEIKID